MTRKEALARLRESVETWGGVRAWAHAHGFSAGFVSDVLRQQRGPSGRILAAVGLMRVKVEDEYFVEGPIIRKGKIL